MKEFVRKLLPQTKKSHRILSGVLSRDMIVTSWQNYPVAILRYAERPLLDWFPRRIKLEEIWLDLGSYYGFTTIFMSMLVGPSGRVVPSSP